MEQRIEAQPETGDKGRWGFHTVCLWLLIVLLVASAVAVRTPAMTSGVRLVLVITLFFGMFTGLVYLIRLFSSYPRLLYPAVFFLGLAIIWAVLGNKPYDVKMLRSTYMKRLGMRQGTPFVWGGETDRGIDCSGLARSALWQAMLTEGVREVNPRLLGCNFLRFWWRDMSARDMLEGKYGYTRVIGHAPKIAGYDVSRLQRGDLAITRSSHHVLILFMDDKWIEASPKDWRVVANPAPADSKRGYFNEPVTFVRWWILEKRKAVDRW